jgi:hypothetical protein
MNWRCIFSRPWMILVCVIWVIGLCWFAYVADYRQALGVVIGSLLSLWAVKVFKKPTT